MKRARATRGRSLLLAAAAPVAFCAASGCGRDPGTPDGERAEHPDIVLVSIDSLRFDHLGCYGYGPPTSPTIDRLAAEGVRFENALSTTSWTLPAHAALFTGLYDSAHRVVKNGRRLAEGHLTLAEALRDEGYQTAGFYGGPFLHPAYGLDQGFDHYQSCMETLPDELSRAEVEVLAEEELATSAGSVTGPRTLEAVARWMDAADRPAPEAGGYQRGRPFFLFVHLWDVHYDYAAPSEYVRRFDPDYQGSLDARNFEKNEALHAGMPARDLEHLIALYDAEICFTDDILGRMLAALRERGMLANALIVITADHGEEFFEHGAKGHGHTLFDEVVRVPLIFHWPGHLEAGRVVTDQVRLIDLMPTLLALAGSARPSREQGRDVGPLLRGGALASEPALCEVQMGRPRLRALRTSEYKLIEALGDGGPAYAYDLELDPGEHRRLGPEAEPWRARLETLGRLQEAVEARPGPRARAAELSDELRARLGDLGYADADE